MSKTSSTSRLREQTIDTSESPDSFIDQGSIFRRGIDAFPQVRIFMDHRFGITLTDTVTIYVVQYNIPDRHRIQLLLRDLEIRLHRRQDRHESRHKVG